jgi:hypothetical protein
MGQRGRKKGCTDKEAVALRKQLYEAYDTLHSVEKQEDDIRASYLPRSYYVHKLFEMHISSWSKSRIRRLLMYRYMYE